MNRQSYVWLTLASMLTAPLCTADTSNDGIQVDRTPLTFRDSGLYCNVQFVHGRQPAEDGVTNMLSRKRASRRDIPWDFYIMQCNMNQPTPDTVDMLKEMARNNRKVVLRVKLPGGLHASLDLEACQERLEKVFEDLSPDWLYAITLDEENVYWHGNAATLSKLYHWCKKRWPSLPVYQWWTPMVAPDVNATGGWVALPADGWVMDLYGIRGAQFEKKLIRFRETGKPLLHIAWASPEWIFYNKAGYSEENWWNNAGREVFDEQLRICRGYNIPVAYFCTQKGVVKEGKKVAGIRWGWHAVDPVVRRWFKELEAIVSEFDYLPAEEIGFRELTPAKFAWAHSSPKVQVSVALDEQDRRRVTWQTSLKDVSTATGEHELERPYDNPYIKIFYRLDESAKRLRDSGFAVRGIKGYAVHVPVVFRITPMQSLADVQVCLSVRATKALGGSVKLAVSPDGAEWTEAASSDPKAKSETLQVTPPGHESVNSGDSLWVKATLSCNAGAPTNIASTITSIEVSASIP
ncbi:MAG: hypothetical protein K9N51_05950 [Candidatus Pacebacteria bacterium]|nr:hypothetical protein [Candidatus Paceibacterota bacterium]